VGVYMEPGGAVDRKSLETKAIMCSTNGFLFESHDIDIQFKFCSHSIPFLNFLASVRGATVSTSTRIGSPLRRLDADVV
jgi:hypothetical protein